jgi:hypothetical protein
MSRDRHTGGIGREGSLSHVDHRSRIFEARRRMPSPGRRMHCGVQPLDPHIRSRPLADVGRRSCRQQSAPRTGLDPTRKTPPQTLCKCIAEIQRTGAGTLKAIAQEVGSARRADPGRPGPLGRQASLAAVGRLIPRPPRQLRLLRHLARHTASRARIAEKNGADPLTPRRPIPIGQPLRLLRQLQRLGCLRWLQHRGCRKGPRHSDLANAFCAESHISC